MSEARFANGLLDEPGRLQHAAWFHDSGPELVRVVARYAQAGLAQGDSVVLVARVDHNAAFLDALSEMGTPTGVALGNGQLSCVDASRALERLEQPGTLEAKHFAGLLGDLLVPARFPDASGKVRVYGEVVDLLCERGDHDAAIRLEDLWNRFQLQRGLPSSILCGYSTASFDRSTHGPAYQRVCKQHSHVESTADTR